MRTIETHRVNECNEKLTIEVLGEPGAGGANHLYFVSGMDTSKNASANDIAESDGDGGLAILFQNGPIPENGTNGITQEVLLAIVIDRLESFQNGPYACLENAEALEYVCKAQERLHSRTRARLERGVEGTSAV